MPKLFCFLLILFAFPFLYAQEFGYTRYDQTEGLAGSTVNCMIQDNEGFLWFGTETGLSRFDGTHFKNYTQKDGLPSDEVIKLFADKKGRVWIAPFRKSICYYYRGKLHNPLNNEILRKIKIYELVMKFAEDSEGNILVQEKHRLHLIRPNGDVQTITQINGSPAALFVEVAPCPQGGFFVVDKNTVYRFAKDSFAIVKQLPYSKQHYATCHISDSIWTWRHNLFAVMVHSVNNKTAFTTHHTKSMLNYSIVDDRYVAACTSNGVYLYDVDEPGYMQHMLPRTAVYNVIKDYEGNLWFGTAGQGVFRLNSLHIYNLYAATITNKSAQRQPVSALTKYGSSIIVGVDGDSIYRISPQTGMLQNRAIDISTFSELPVKLLCPLNGYFVYATKMSVHRLSKDHSTDQEIPYVYAKTLFPYKDQIYAATDRNIIRIDPVRFRIVDTVWHERSTTVYADRDTFYIGTLNGLYCRFPNGATVNMGDRFPSFHQRISAICKDSAGILWVATYGNGVLAYKDGRIVATIRKDQGLTSDICRTVFLQRDALWVGTDMGLNKIDLTHPSYPVLKYTTADGLLSDDITSIYVEGTRVFTGTAQGITFFDDKKIDRYSRCHLVFTGIVVSGASRQWDSTIMSIPHDKNNIRFDYVGISYKSAGNIRYRYRLIGLDSNWQETNETFLSYPTLPSGDYELQVQAINKFDVHSSVLRARFTIEQLLWERTWFRLLAAFVFLAITGMLVWLIALRIRYREQEKNSIGQRITDLEQLARKAQMNPHFIFNSLNSIQQYVMDADLAGANKFIAGFSRLIRQTLDFSSRREISLEEELDYLKNYLDLEKNRLEDAFSWQVTVGEAIDPADHYLPPMILQPFVENSIRHGLRFRKDKSGKITIGIEKQHNFLICVMEDNGVGRKVAQRLKSSSHIGYQSKGMSLTAERIMLLNKNNANRITMQIDDLEDEQQNPLGTRVIITFPIN